MHRFDLRVYYEDTDLAGIVYYANYLKFIERARSEYLRELGIDQAALKADGHVFVVRRVVADYLSPGLYDDLLTVETSIASQSAARLILRQVVLRGETPLFQADVTIAFIDASGKPQRIPANFRPK